MVGKVEVTLAKRTYFFQHILIVPKCDLKRVLKSLMLLNFTLCLVQLIGRPYEFTTTIFTCPFLVSLSVAP